MVLALPSGVSGGLAPTAQPSFSLWTRRPKFPAGLYPQNEEETHARRLLIPSTLPLQTDFKSTNVIFWGRRGKGKTLSMVGISKILAPGFYKAHWRVQANIPLDFSDIGLPQVNCHPLLGSFIAADMDKAQRSLIDFDELTEIVPSRKAMTKSNYNSNSVMVQIRKLQCEVMSTTQFPTDVDRQMLRQLDLWVLCEAYIPRDARWNPYSAARAYVKLYVFDLWGQFTGNYLAAKYFPPPLHMAMKTMYLHNLPGAWGSYKTAFKVVSEHATEDTKERMVSRHWDVENLERMEEEAYLETERSNPAAKDWNEAIEARFREAEAHPTEPPPSQVVSLTPQSIAGWITEKRIAGRLKITNGTIKEVQKFLPKVQTVAEVLRVLEAHGFDTDQSEGGWYAQAR